MIRRRFCCTLLALAILPGSLAAADELQTTSKDLMKKYGPALVRVHATSQLQQTGLGVARGQKDRISHSQGIVVDESGLAIVARSSFDPSALMKGLTVNVGGQEVAFKYKNKFKKIEMELADGTRVPARVLIVDPKWDLVVVAPKKPLPAGKFAFVPIGANEAAEVSTMDRLIFLRRLNPLLNNQVAVGIASVAAVIEKPVRMIYTSAGQPSLPAFTADGQLLGITALKMPSINDMISNAEKPQFGVLSCKYIREVLEQARKNLE